MAIEATEKRMSGRLIIRLPESGEEAYEIDEFDLSITETSSVLYDGVFLMGALRTGQARDSGYGDFRETVTEILIPLEAWADSEVPLDAAVEVLEGPGQGREWKITGLLHHTDSIARRFQIRRLDDEINSA